MAKLAPMATRIGINQWSQVFKYYINDYANIFYVM